MNKAELISAIAEKAIADGLFKEAGFEPVERDTFYHPVETGEEAVK